MAKNVGKYRQRLAIQTQTEAANAYGEAVPTWTTQATRWGRIEPVSARELWLSQQIHPDATHKITIRYYAGLQPQHRLLYSLPAGQSRVFNILSILTPSEIHSVSNEMQLIVIEEIFAAVATTNAGIPIAPGPFFQLTY